ERAVLLDELARFEDERLPADCVDATARVRAAESFHISQPILHLEQSDAFSADCFVIPLEDFQLRIVAHVIASEARTALDQTRALSRFEQTVDQARSRALGLG